MTPQQAVFRNGDAAPDGWTHWKDRNTRGKVGNAATSAPVGIASTGSQPQPAAQNYRSSVNVGGGIGRQGVLSGLLSTGNQPNPNVSALARGAAWNDASQIGRGIDAQNQQLQMEQQAKRSELTTSGATNLSKIYGDYAERSNSQVGLAAQIAANNIGFAGGVQSAFNPWSALRGGMR